MREAAARSKALTRREALARAALAGAMVGALAGAACTDAVLSGTRRRSVGRRIHSKHQCRGSQTNVWRFL